jgi:hypothetical protein
MTQGDQDWAEVRPPTFQRAKFIVGYWLFVAGLPCLFGWPIFQRYLAHREEARRQEIVMAAGQFAQNYWQGEGDMNVYAAHVNNPVTYTLRLEGANSARVTLVIDRAGPANASKEVITVELSRNDLGQWQGDFLHKSPVTA